MELPEREVGALSVTGLARELSISRGLLYKLMRNGDAPESFKVGNRRLFSRAAIRSWIAEREAKERRRRAGSLSR